MSFLICTGNSTKVKGGKQDLIVKVMRKKFQIIDENELFRVIFSKKFEELGKNKKYATVDNTVLIAEAKTFAQKSIQQAIANGYIRYFSEIVCVRDSRVATPSDSDMIARVLVKEGETISYNVLYRVLVEFYKLTNRVSEEWPAEKRATASIEASLRHGFIECV